MMGKDNRLYVYILKPLNEVDESMLYCLFDEIVEQDIEDLEIGMRKIRSLKFQAFLHTIAFPFLLITSFLTKGFKGVRKCFADEVTVLKYFFTPMRTLTVNFYKDKKFEGVK